MGLFESVVVFVIAWWLFFLPSLSAGGQSQAEAGEIVPGSEPGAPKGWNIRNKLLFATASAIVVTLVFWVTISLGLLDGLIPTEN